MLFKTLSGAAFAFHGHPGRAVFHGAYSPPDDDAFYSMEMSECVAGHRTFDCTMYESRSGASGTLRIDIERERLYFDAETYRLFGSGEAVEFEPFPAERSYRHKFLLPGGGHLLVATPARTLSYTRATLTEVRDGEMQMLRVERVIESGRSAFIATRTGTLAILRPKVVAPTIQWSTPDERTRGLVAWTGIPDETWTTVALELAECDETGMPMDPSLRVTCGPAPVRGLYRHPDGTYIMDARADDQASGIYVGANPDRLEDAFSEWAWHGFEDGAVAEISTTHGKLTYTDGVPRWNGDAVEVLDLAEYDVAQW